MQGLEFELIYIWLHLIYIIYEKSVGCYGGATTRYSPIARVAGATRYWHNSNLDLDIVWAGLSEHIGGIGFYKLQIKLKKMKRLSKQCWKGQLKNSSRLYIHARVDLNSSIVNTSSGD